MVNYITLKDEQYPNLLREIYNPPKKLFYRGNVNLLKKTCISIVGTRKSSEYGEYVTKKIINELSILKLIIVSGLAKGIDKIAHQEALKNNLPTIAVIGSGIENIYPKENLNLAEKIEKNGLIISEYEPDSPPKNFHFPQRNRIISGLSIATIIIEAPEKSGALITAKLALDQGREIFALVGDIDRKNLVGNLRLIQNSGAYPISSGGDVISVLKRQPHLFRLNEPKKEEIKTPDLDKYSLSKDEYKVLSSMLKLRSKTIDEIQKSCDLPTNKILSILSILEIKNLIKIKDGKYLLK